MSVASDEWVCALCSHEFNRKSRWTQHLKFNHQLEDSEVEQLAAASAREMEIKAAKNNNDEQSDEDDDDDEEDATPISASLPMPPTTSPKSAAAAPVYASDSDDASDSQDANMNGNELSATEDEDDDIDMAAAAASIANAAEEIHRDHADSSTRPSSSLSQSEANSKPSSSTPPRLTFRLSELKRRTPVERRRSSAAARHSSDESDNEERADSTPMQEATATRRSARESKPAPPRDVLPQASFTSGLLPSPNAPGSSCHVCRAFKPGQIVACNSWKQPGKKCHKRYCFQCMLKHHQLTPDQINAETFICPSCKNQCSCAKCRYNLKNKTAKLTGAATTSSNSQRFPDSKRPPFVDNKVSTPPQPVSNDLSPSPARPTHRPGGDLIRKQLPPVPLVNSFQSPQHPSQHSINNHLLHHPSSSNAPLRVTAPPVVMQKVYGFAASGQPHILTLKPNETSEGGTEPYERHVILPRLCLPNSLAISLRVPPQNQRKFALPLTTTPFPAFSVSFLIAGQPFYVPPDATYTLNNIALDDPVMEKIDAGANGLSHHAGWNVTSKSGSGPQAVIEVLSEKVAVGMQQITQTPNTATASVPHANPVSHPTKRKDRGEENEDIELESAMKKAKAQHSNSETTTASVNA